MRNHLHMNRTLAHAIQMTGGLLSFKEMRFLEKTVSQIKISVGEYGLATQVERYLHQWHSEYCW